MTKMMDKTLNLRVSYVLPRVKYLSCEPIRMIAESGDGGAGKVEPDPGGDITDSKCLDLHLSESPSFGASHSDVWSDN